MSVEVAQGVVTYGIEAHGVSYTISKPAPCGDPAICYEHGGRLDADLRVGYPYELALLEDIYERHLDGLFIDIGAHVGNHTVWLAKVCGLRVAAFEPSDRSRPWIKRNVVENGIKDMVSVHDVALGPNNARASWGEVPGHIEFGVDGQVQVCPLDNYEFEGVVGIKIDVEGNEPQVLAGAVQTLQSSRPIVWAEAISDEAVARIDAVLSPIGYTLQKMVRVSSPLGCWEAQ